MAYLRKSDYNHLIQEFNLNQITSGNDSILDKCEQIAIAEIKGYLSARFEVDNELNSVTLFSSSATYTAGKIVYIDGEEYDDGKTYALDAIVNHLNKIYICIQAGVDKMGDVSYWTLLGDKDDLFYAKFPSPEFDFEKAYKKDDQVFYKGREYTAIKPSQGIKPDDPTYGVQFWGEGEAYTFTGQLPTNTTYFTHGDLRNQQLLMVAIDMTLYHLHKRIAPRNIPELRVKCYDDAVIWLSKCADGKIIPNLELIQPKSQASGLRTRFGYNVKNQNNY